MIGRLFDSGAMPSLERTVQFAAQRHKLLVHDIANLSTPNFRPQDLDVESFQATLGRAIDERREKRGGPTGELTLRDTRELRFDKQGMTVKADDRRDNLLFHDRNDRSVEHLMHQLAENVGAHNTAIEFLRSEFELLHQAIREQP